jgi:Domain of unknown function (DUF397)
MTSTDLWRPVWHKSSHSNAQGNCVEVAILWEKSSRSNGQANCVEVSRGVPGVVAVRDSKEPDGPKLMFSTEQWRAFVAGVRGESGG